jgi:hypothetical protein
MTDRLSACYRAAALAALPLLAACAAHDAQRPPPLEREARHELQLIECQQRAQNRPNEAQLLAECNHPRIGG